MSCFCRYNVPFPRPGAIVSIFDFNIVVFEFHSMISCSELQIHRSTAAYRFTFKQEFCEERNYVSDDKKDIEGLRFFYI